MRFFFFFEAHILRTTMGKKPLYIFVSLGISVSWNFLDSGKGFLFKYQPLHLYYSLESYTTRLRVTTADTGILQVTFYLALRLLNFMQINDLFFYLYSSVTH